MKKLAKELLGVSLSALLLLQFPIYAIAGDPFYIEDGDISVHATDSGQRVEQGSRDEVDNDPVITNHDKDTASDNHVSITADAGSTAHVTISDLNIATSVAAIQTDGDGSVEIKLAGDNYVTSGDTYAGIEKGNNGSLTISAGSVDDSLEAKGGNSGAGIGGHDGLDVNDIIITGGDISAEGGQYAAGIGGGYGGDGTGITISGGQVSAFGGSDGAGIGGGQDADGKNITITGGTVTAEGRESGAGIGGGGGGHGTDITITGGIIRVDGRGSGAGIGGGRFGDGTNITITGGLVVANSTQTGAGIGGGESGNGNNIKITGGDVTAGGNGPGAGIGGSRGGNGTDIIITGGDVYAIGRSNGAGIGGGEVGDGRAITINGGTVYADGNRAGAGIGGGYGGDGENISINGGTVIAVSRSYGAGIGGGRDGNGSDISVSNYANVMVAGGAVDYLGVDLHGAGIGSGIQILSEIINGEEVNPNISRLYDSVVISYYPPGTTIDDIRMGNVQPISMVRGILKPESNHTVDPESDSAIESLIEFDGGSSDHTSYEDNSEIKDIPTSSEEFAAFLAQTNNTLEAYLKKIEAMMEAGDTEGLNALISKGITLETGNWICFNKKTYALIEKISDYGVPVTVSFAYKGHRYNTVIPGNTKIKPLDLCNEEGYCGFLNLIKYYGGTEK